MGEATRLVDMSELAREGCVKETNLEDYFRNGVNAGEVRTQPA